MPNETDREKDRRERERQRILKEQKDYAAEQQRQKRIHDQTVRDTHKPPKPPDDEK